MRIQSIESPAIGFKSILGNRLPRLSETSQETQAKELEYIKLKSEVKNVQVEPKKPWKFKRSSS